MRKKMNQFTEHSHLFLYSVHNQHKEKGRMITCNQCLCDTVTTASFYVKLCSILFKLRPKF